MAQAELQLSPSPMSCSICLDLLKDPATLPCRHSFCLNCINSHWDQQDGKEIYCCPLCLKKFMPRPVLEKNTLLAMLVMEHNDTGLHAAPADHGSAGPEDVACDLCTGRKLRAIKSCQVCLVSYCEEHLQPHYRVAPLKKHKLVEPSKKLQENICSRHDEVMKMFCRTDQQRICYLCSLEDHKDHDTVSAAAERSERQKDLQVRRLNIQERIQVREEDLKVLQQEVEKINRSADKAVEHGEKVFIEMILLMESGRLDVKQQVRSRQEAEVRRVQELQQKLEQEITELKRKDAEQEDLSGTEDHYQFLHNYSSLSALGGPPPSSSISNHPLTYFEEVTAAVSKVREMIQDIMRKIWTNISLTEVDASQPQPEPDPGPDREVMTRGGISRLSCKITLDPNTANTYLLLAKANRKVTLMSRPQIYLSRSERFSVYAQVLAREILTGRCYWEVEKKGVVGIAVTYKEIRREGRSEECGFGRNDKSWMLYCDKDSYLFCHKNIKSPVLGPKTSRVGVFLDHDAGILSFYSVSGEARSLLHRVRTSFTHPVYAGLGLGPESSAEVCRVK